MLDSWDRNLGKCTRKKEISDLAQRESRKNKSESLVWASRFIATLWEQIHDNWEINLTPRISRVPFPYGYLYWVHQCQLNNQLVDQQPSLFYLDNKIGDRMMFIVERMMREIKNRDREKGRNLKVKRILVAVVLLLPYPLFNLPPVTDFWLRRKVPVLTNFQFLSPSLPRQNYNSLLQYL